MGDFFAFRRMLMPVLIQIFFWLAVFSSWAIGGAILAGQYDPLPEANRVLPSDFMNAQFVKDNFKLAAGLHFIIVMPLVIRLWCEFCVLLFRINDTLTDIRNGLLLQREGVAAAPTPRR